MWFWQVSSLYQHWWRSLLPFSPRGESEVVKCRHFHLATEGRRQLSTVKWFGEFPVFNESLVATVLVLSGHGCHSIHIECRQCSWQTMPAILAHLVHQSHPIPTQREILKWENLTQMTIHRSFCCSICKIDSHCMSLLPSKDVETHNSL